VASDGVWDTISGGEAFKLIESSKTPEKASKKLVNYAVHSLKCEDNITAIVVYL
jgi:serine/threonine protein phosphatase PrpC